MNINMSMNRGYEGQQPPHPNQFHGRSHPSHPSHPYVHLQPLQPIQQKQQEIKPLEVKTEVKKES
eukprot:Pgem_evm1s12039